MITDEMMLKAMDEFYFYSSATYVERVRRAVLAIESELIAQGMEKAAEMVEAWMQSPCSEPPEDAIRAAAAQTRK